MSENLFIGTKHELLIASRLIESGIMVSKPLVDIGVDFIASNKNFTKNVPIQVKYKESERNIFFTGSEIESYKSKNVYIAYLLKDSEWFMPFSTFIDLACFPNRKDQAAYIKLNNTSTDLSPYLGDEGFKNMVSFIKNE